MLNRLSWELKAASFLLGSPSGFYNLAKPSRPYSKPGPPVQKSPTAGFRPSEPITCYAAAST